MNDATSRDGAAHESMLAPDFREEPYWWRAAPRPQLPVRELPRQVRAAVVGSGVSGLNAALVLARAGHSVLVLDAEDVGWGATTRNAGFVARSHQWPFLTLARRHGIAHAKAVYSEVVDAFDTTAELVGKESIACHFRICGRFNLAASPGHYEAMAREFDALRQHVGIESEMVPPGQEHREIAVGDGYYGGLLVPQLGCLHPGLYHQGLLDRVRAAGATIAANTQVTGVERLGERRFAVHTARGTAFAGSVVVATNGYTGPPLPEFHRRLVPFSSFMIATEELDPERLARLTPTNRNYAESTHNPLFARRSPDGLRLLFGGLTGSSDSGGALPAAARLRSALERMLPDLQGVRIGNAWSGRCAGTFDRSPRIGTLDGVHFVIGMNFSGLAIGTYLGRKIAFKVLGSPEAATIFDKARFPTLPLYSGSPWFLPLFLRYHAWQDRRLACKSLHSPQIKRSLARSASSPPKAAA